LRQIIHVPCRVMILAILAETFSINLCFVASCSCFKKNKIWAKDKNGVLWFIKSKLWIAHGHKKFELESLFCMVQTFFIDALQIVCTILIIIVYDNQNM
jgi:hypothetical protein